MAAGRDAAGIALYLRKIDTLPARSPPPCHAGSGCRVLASLVVPSWLVAGVWRHYCHGP
jgi:hypothetical protein